MLIADRAVDRLSGRVESRQSDPGGADLGDYGCHQGQAHSATAKFRRDAHAVVTHGQHEVVRLRCKANPNSLGSGVPGSIVGRFLSDPV